MDADLLSEVQTFLNESGVVSRTDAAAIFGILQRLPVARQRLEMHASVHMDIEADLAWLTSKYNQMYRQAEAKNAAYRGSVIKDCRKRELPQYVINGVLDADPECIQLAEQQHKLYRIYDLLERLSHSLRRRETMINYLRKLDEH